MEMARIELASKETLYPTLHACLIVPLNAELGSEAQWARPFA